MVNEIKSITIINGKNKFPILWFSVFVIVILFFTFYTQNPIQNSWQQPLNDFQTALNIKDSRVKPTKLKEAGSRLAAIQSKLNIHPVINLNVGYYYFAMGEMDSVINSQINVINNTPKDDKEKIASNATDLLINATANKSKQLIAKGDSAEAFKLLIKAASYSGDNNHLNRNIAGFYLSQGKISPAIFHYSMALKSNNRDVESMIGLAKAYYYIGQTDSASNYTKKALELNSTDTEAVMMNSIIGEKTK
ncbi:MAG: tetratricopeptide repeat protein [Candidatus Kapabacteria bacterium]|nr:tetratricopeptide repeat protein [Ignavibacteriota bacterium]MCW5885262.1 tetratricopeptide repeat protein [Candidatus Kapabacteria bacterium]